MGVPHLRGVVCRNIHCYGSPLEMNRKKFLVDSNSFIFYVMEQLFPLGANTFKVGLSMIFGGHYIGLFDALEKIILSFLSCQVILVFVFESSVDDDSSIFKITTQRDRRRNQLNVAANFLSCFTKNNNAHFTPPHSFPIPFLFKSVLKDVLEKWNIPIIHTKCEADLFIAQQLRDDFTFSAVLSNDSDFIIFQDSRWIMLDRLDFFTARGPINIFDSSINPKLVKTIKGFCCKNKAFLNYFGLSFNRLVEVALLSGCDVTKSSILNSSVHAVVKNQVGRAGLTNTLRNSAARSLIPIPNQSIQFVKTFPPNTLLEDHPQIMLQLQKYQDLNRAFQVGRLFYTISPQKEQQKVTNPCYCSFCSDLHQYFRIKLQNRYEIDSNLDNSIVDDSSSKTECYTPQWFYNFIDHDVYSTSSNQTVFSSKLEETKLNDKQTLKSSPPSIIRFSFIFNSKRSGPKNVLNIAFEPNLGPLTSFKLSQPLRVCAYSCIEMAEVTEIVQEGTNIHENELKIPNLEKFVRFSLFHEQQITPQLLADLNLTTCLNDRHSILHALVMGTCYHSVIKQKFIIPQDLKNIVDDPIFSAPSFHFLFILITRQMIWLGNTQITDRDKQMPLTIHALRCLVNMWLTLRSVDVSHNKSVFQLRSQNLSPNLHLLRISSWYQLSVLLVSSFANFLLLDGDYNITPYKFFDGHIFANFWFNLVPDMPDTEQLIHIILWQFSEPSLELPIQPDFRNLIAFSVPQTPIASNINETNENKINEIFFSDESSIDCGVLSEQQIDEPTSILRKPNNNKSGNTRSKNKSKRNQKHRRK